MTESLLFLVQITIPGHDLDRQELRYLLFYRALSGKKVPSGSFDVTEFCLVELGGKPSLQETALLGKFWLIGPPMLKNLGLKRKWFLL